MMMVTPHLCFLCCGHWRSTLVRLFYSSRKLTKICGTYNIGQGGASGKPTAATLYLNLVRKHLPSFYKFVHAVHKQDDGIFHDLLEWIESIITFMRTGFGHARVDYKT